MFRHITVLVIALAAPLSIRAATLYAGLACPFATIQSALDFASPGDVIRVRVGTYKESLFIDKAVQLRGGHIGCSGTALNGLSVIEPSPSLPHARLVDLSGNAFDVTLTGFTLRNADAADGAALRVGSNTTATLGTMEFINNAAPASRGGAILLNVGAVLTGPSAFSLRFEGNSAIVGGAIYAERNALVDFATPFGIALDFVNNSDDAIYASAGSTVRLRNATISSNAALQAIAIRAQATPAFATSLELSNTIVRDHAPNGAIVTSGAQMTVNFNNVSFYNNRTSSLGGALTSDGQVDLTNCLFDGNRAVVAGGAVSFQGTALTVSGTTFSDNQASSGGAIDHQTGTLTLRGSATRDLLFQDNQAPTGGALYLRSDGVTRINPDLTDTRSVIFRGNVGDGQGGAIYMLHNAVQLQMDAPVLFDANFSGQGGALFAQDGGWQLRGRGAASIVFRDNGASDSGGAIYADNSGAQDINANLVAPGEVVFDGNSSTGQGGGAIFQNAGSLHLYAPIRFVDNQAAGSVGRGGHVLAKATVNAAGYLNGTRGIRMEGGYAVDGGAALALPAGSSLWSWVDIGSDPANPNQAFSGDGGALLAQGAGTTVSLINSRIANSRTPDNGGGIAVHSGATVSIDSLLVPAVPGATVPACDPALLPFDRYCSELRDNASLGQDGGGAYVAAATLNLRNTAIMNNTVDTMFPNRGGGLFIAGGGIVNGSNLLLAGNRRSVGASGTGLGVFEHVTLTGDSMTAIGLLDAAHISLSNSVFWGNATAASVPAGTLLDGNGCGISQRAGLGVFADPLLITSARGAYRLGPGSPAVDLCNSGLGNDLDGRLRPVGVRFDAGAFEGTNVAQTDLIFANGFDP